MWLLRLLGRMIALRGARIILASVVVLLAAIIGVGAQIRPTDTSSATRAPGNACVGQLASSAGGPAGSSCQMGNDLLANSIARAASVASRPTAAPVPKAVQNAYANQPPNTIGQPCHDSFMFVANISQWTTPPGCYANIYTPDRSLYSAPSTFGYCNWWVEALHPKQQDILYGSEYARTTTPIVGSAIWFPPNVQGASSAGHWAQVVAIGPDHYWLLITEMNFGWRGGGFGKVDYRYAHVDPAAGVEFIH